MPKALILADLHIDFWRERRVDLFAGIDFSDTDLLFLAGDIVNNGHVQWKHVLKDLSDHFDLSKTHIFPGNHDYYGGKIDREDKLRAATEAAGAHFAQCSEVISGSARFLCCTLWTDMRLGGASQPINMMRAEGVMNDYRKIRIESEGYRRLSASHTAVLHTRHRDWLRERLAAGFHGDTHVITHHAPHLKSLQEHASVPFAYASDLSDLIHEYQPATWHHGHTHFPVEYEIGATRICNVSIGYPSDSCLTHEGHDPSRWELFWEDAPTPSLL